ncbi:hypothetical protein APR41_08940 [Salegentibacter salinarum]|uniref:Uncharacterized protein n=1 Tax=Salegentibacter salinarum TaxID=447422 RepID=A0A2N0TNY8_9FLAO|nr:hypothetical protein APR41_08940 [Salegentibacter salinarum]
MYVFNFSYFFKYSNLQLNKKQLILLLPALPGININGTREITKSFSQPKCIGHQGFKENQSL